MNRKPVFDAVRHLLGRGFSQSEVAHLDRALDEAVGPDGNLSLDRVPCVPDLRIGPAGVQLIKRFEGCARRRPDGRVEAHPDPATGDAPWTIGWGATGPNIVRGTVWSQDECDARLNDDLVRYADDVRAAIGSAPTTQAQFDALVSFHYNTGAITRATLTRLHCSGDYAGAATEFTRWNRAGGQVMPGLTRRRAAEAALYRSGQ